MCAYSTINGEFACQNQYLMNTTLDQQWGFPGFVTSDYQATHSTVQSADAGMDQEMPAPQFYGPALQAAVQSGQVSTATLNEMVGRILTEMFRFNEFNNPPTGSTGATVTTRGASGGLDHGRGGGHGAAEEPATPRCRCTRPGRVRSR